MKGVGVKLELRVRSSGRVAHDDRLYIIKRLRTGTADIGEERFPVLAHEKLGELGNGAEQFGPNRNPPGDRIPLLVFASLEVAIQQRCLNPGEAFPGNEVANFDKTVPVELRPPFGWNGFRETPPP